MTSTTIRTRADLVWQEVDDQVVVLDPGTSTYHGVTGAGTTLWPLLVRGTTRAELVAELRSVFSVEAARAEDDVEVFLTELAPFLREP
ncbi:PqqD family protein [Kineococcus sp. LSe6-4]|uniref:PqqD family protein n=1 Tax=Kineococcus halophytocola TaxID=3234027 RepID=A0ABV4H4N3_9ACTN